MPNFHKAQPHNKHTSQGALKESTTIMAPIAPPDKKPSARTLRHQRVTGQIHPLLPAKIHRPETLSSDSFLSSKRDRRTIKHSSFLSRVRQSDSSARVSKSRPKRKATSATTAVAGSTVPGASRLKTGKTATGAKKRRPKNKIASLDSLADALPDLLEDEDGVNLGKVKHRSLESKKGALKRKEIVVKGEMARFGASMARLNETSTDAGPAQAPAGGEDTVVTDGKPATSDRWAALRGYISTTMEQNPAFANKP